MMRFTSLRRWGVGVMGCLALAGALAFIGPTNPAAAATDSTVTNCAIAVGAATGFTGAATHLYSDVKHNQSESTVSADLADTSSAATSLALALNKAPACGNLVKGDAGGGLVAAGLAAAAAVGSFTYYVIWPAFWNFLQWLVRILEPLLT
jgi:hypothetical protein